MDQYINILTYLVQAWATSCSSFAEIPYDLLCSCLEHPWLTVEWFVIYSYNLMVITLIIWQFYEYQYSDLKSSSARSNSVKRLKFGLLIILNLLRAHLSTLEGTILSSLRRSTTELLVFYFYCFPPEQCLQIFFSCFCSKHWGIMLFLQLSVTVCILIYS